MYADKAKEGNRAQASLTQGTKVAVMISSARCAKLREAMRKKFQHKEDKQLYGLSNQQCTLTKVKTFGPSKFQPRETSGCDDQVTSNIKTAHIFLINGKSFSAMHGVESGMKLTACIEF